MFVCIFCQSTLWKQQVYLDSNAIWVWDYNETVTEWSTFSFPDLGSDYIFSKCSLQDDSSNDFYGYYSTITYETYLNEGIFEIEFEGQFSSSVTDEYWGFDSLVITYDMPETTLDHSDNRWTDDMSNDLWTYAEYTNISSYGTWHGFYAHETPNINRKFTFSDTSKQYYIYFTFDLIVGCTIEDDDKIQVRVFHCFFVFFFHAYVFCAFCVLHALHPTSLFSSNVLCFPGLITSLFVEWSPTGRHVSLFFFC